MKTFWAQPLRRQLIVANLVLCVGPVLGLAVWSGMATLRDRREGLRTQAQRVAETMATDLSQHLEGIDAYARTLVAEPALQSLEPDSIKVRLEQLIAARPAVVGLAVSSGGRLLASAQAPDLALDLSVPPEDSPSASRQPQRAAPASPHASSLVTMRYPIVGSGGTRGTLSMFVDAARLHQILHELPLPEGSIVTITDGEDHLIGASGSADGDARRALYGNRTGRVPLDEEITGGDGVTRTRVAAPVPAGAWTLTVGLPSDVPADVVAAVWLRSFAVLAISLAGCFLGAWFLARRLGGSVSHLHTAAKRIAAGDFGPLPSRPMRSAEFADLQVAFVSMLAQFNATHAALDAQMTEERRIRKELESLQTQVIQQERLAAVGQLVSGVAHEINNPLQAILGFAELLQLQRDVPESVKGDLKLIQKESARACAIIRNLALFARQQPGEAAPVTMSQVIRSVAELRQRRLESEDIELRIEDDAASPVKAILTELQQVVLNFVVNAEQAIIASGRLPGRITLRTYDREQRVIMEVEDTGPGIPEENEAKLFQPFFTTKPVGQGTGLGLSISYGIIDSLGGTIGYRRAPAGGAVFYFELPATIARAA